jgi:hypothetical protein
MAAIQVLKTQRAASDQLILGGLIFDDWSTPERIPFGGLQSMHVHKLPGGSRVVDTLGPDEMDITWHGTFWGDGAYDVALALNGMRQAGQPLPLTFGGQFYTVLISDAHVDIHRYPLHATYSITCVVTSSPMVGVLSGAVSSIDTLVSADIATALSFAGL